ncbi:MAG: hypothetical protein R2818_10590 [Flavobacteriales bacterium]
MKTLRWPGGPLGFDQENDTVVELRIADAPFLANVEREVRFGQSAKRIHHDHQDAAARFRANSTTWH